MALDKHLVVLDLSRNGLKTEVWGGGMGVVGGFLLSSDTL